jgi:hypothetical protein
MSAAENILQAAAVAVRGQRVQMQLLIKQVQAAQGLTHIHLGLLQPQQELVVFTQAVVAVV